MSLELENALLGEKVKFLSKQNARLKSSIVRLHREVGGLQERYRSVNLRAKAAEGQVKAFEVNDVYESLAKAKVLLDFTYRAARCGDCKETADRPCEQQCLGDIHSRVREILGSRNGS